MMLYVIPTGPRRFVWRQTIGRFQSEESIFRAAEAKAQTLKQNVESHAAEGQKLSERLAAAQEQYNSGLSKLQATNRQLQSLLSSVSLHLALQVQYMHAVSRQNLHRRQCLHAGC